MPQNLTAPIFILGSHKSGSSLLRSLLDSHPRLFVFPKEIHFFQYAGYWVDYRLRSANPVSLSREQLIKRLYEVVTGYNRSEDPYADSIIAGKFNMELFKKTMEAGNFDTARDRFESYADAFCAALTGKALDPNLRLVEKSVENSEWAPTLRHMFPDSRFIHIVRNPYASLVAIRKAKSKKGYPFLRDPVWSLKNSYYNLYRNADILNGYLIIRYEDLVNETEVVMKRIAGFLEIDFHESLMKPTLFGKLWKGNSTSNQSFDTVARGPSENWKKQITSLEIALVNRSMSHVLSRFGYDLMPENSSFWFPSKGEMPKNYIRNRALLTFL